jgi:hypothetical protein
MEEDHAGFTWSYPAPASTCTGRHAQIAVHAARCTPCASGMDRIRSDRLVIGRDLTSRIAPREVAAQRRSEGTDGLRWMALLFLFRMSSTLFRTISGRQAICVRRRKPSQWVAPPRPLTSDYVPSQGCDRDENTLCALSGGGACHACFAVNPDAVAWNRSR